ncbi:hypothetical protein FQB35_08365 [Crassaminicella thermophila]|uniref:Uncharacterized protein n=1 Tax=Crassaminicella thermophila TaxID=2599308 RepID=A0A5C0SGN8_CRATE|nr:hypothetical protein [Crassaminicella thermophila]QEK12388.1 hypothetical protein FQB35_08365 [Crassaminicella thermophila]
MNLENLDMRIEENVLKFLLKHEFTKEIEEAKEYFYNNLEKAQIMIDFNSWLIYDYKMKDGKSFIEKYYNATKNQLSDEEREWIKKKIESFISLYEVKEIKENKVKLKDIFTKTEFWVDMDCKEINKKDLILGRMIEFLNEYKFIGDSIYIPAIFKNTIERNIIVQYEGYKEKNQYATLEKFLKNNSLLLQKYIAIIMDVTYETENEESYNVWQSTYLIKDLKNIKETLLRYKEIKLDIEEDGSYYFKLFSEGELLAEIVLENNKIELECTSEKDRIKAKKIIESILEDSVKYYKDEIVRLDDLV